MLNFTVPAWVIIVVVIIFAIIDTIRSRRAKYKLPYELMDRHTSELLEKNSKIYETSIEFYKEIIKGYEEQMEILQQATRTTINDSVEMLKFNEYIIKKIIEKDFDESEIQDLIETHEILKEQISMVSK
jgi:hypothetical protein